MRATGQSTELKAAAYAGTYVVVLAWDTLDGKKPSRNDLLGYAIERAELDAGGQRGRALLAARDQALQGQGQRAAARHAGVRRPSIRSRASSGPTTPPRRARATRIRIVPVYGTVKNPKLDDAAAVTLDVTTENRGRSAGAAPATRASGTTSSSIVA